MGTIFIFCELVVRKQDVMELMSEGMNAPHAMWHINMPG